MCFKIPVSSSSKTYAVAMSDTGKMPGVKDTVSVAETVASAAARHDCHRDAVLAMCVAGTGAARALVTCGRDAAVKVWK